MLFRVRLKPPHSTRSSVWRRKDTAGQSSHKQHGGSKCNTIKTFTQSLTSKLKLKISQRWGFEEMSALGLRSNLIDFNKITHTHSCTVQTEMFVIRLLPWLRCLLTGDYKCSCKRFKGRLSQHSGNTQDSRMNSCSSL